MNIEILKIQNVLGFAELDANLRQLVEVELLPEWADVLSLVHATLSEGAYLEELAYQTQEHFSKAQWRATLGFLTTVYSPVEQTLSLSDIGALMLLQKSHREVNEDLLNFVAGLFRLQKIRTAAMGHADFNELLGHEGLKLLKSFRLHAQKVSPHFGAQREQIKRAA